MEVFIRGRLRRSRFKYFDMADVRFSARAYCKILLHAAKYPHCAVNGVLLADSQKNKDQKKSKNIVFVDAVPLFHLCLHVSPMAEIALIQIESMAQASNLVIAGYYIANEALNDMNIEKPANRIADKLVENFSSSCLVVVDNSKVTQILSEPALHLYSSVEGKWKIMDSSSFMVEEKCLDAASTLLQHDAADLLVDFDNHLDNISLNWRNETINEKISCLVQQVTDI